MIPPNFNGDEPDWILGLVIGFAIASVGLSPLIILVLFLVGAI